MKFDSLAFSGDSVPKEIGLLKNLKHLDFCGLTIKHLPNEIGKLTQLTSLTMGTISLNELPPGISGLKNLKSLKLIKVPGIKTLPPEIGDLINLEYLTISWGSRLEKIPPEIGKLKKLKTIDFNFNNLSHLPNEIKNCTQLKKLILMNNHFSKEEQEKIKKLLPNCQIFFDGQRKH